ncbi:MAG TPA: hypothetical protein VKG25_09030 [Bryobacteraceae bacterium]|nr:hypothetical protein [Bryobacteraceae bacterium]
MDKRLVKNHKRKVERAKAKVKISEPDVRTHEEIEAAREASRADSGHAGNMKLGHASRPMRSNNATSTGSAAKTDG